MNHLMKERETPNITPSHLNIMHLDAANDAKLSAMNSA